MATHPVVSHQRVHDRILEGMAHMQTAGDVGWRDGNAVRISVPGRRKLTTTFPCVVKRLFYRMRVIGFAEFVFVHESMAFSTVRVEIYKT